MMVIADVCMNGLVNRLGAHRAPRVTSVRLPQSGNKVYLQRRSQELQLSGGDRWGFSSWRERNPR
jgi:hypothetical protein